MQKLSKRFALTLAAVIISLGSLSAVEIKKIHFLIPGGAGGGWDGTARGTGEALTKFSSSTSMQTVTIVKLYAITSKRRLLLFRLRSSTPAL